MRSQTLAHISDLHVGRSPDCDERAAQLCRTLVEADIDHVVVTGDVTHRGRARELAQFKQAFAPLLDAGRVTVVPGNHDRLGDDLRETIMPGSRVQTETRSGLYLVRLDSTGPHNRSWINGHGMLEEADIDAVDQALWRAPPHHLVVLLLHHHLLPLPDEHAMERLSAWMGLRFTCELARGRALLGRIRGRCDLVLHGHRHQPRVQRPFADARPLRIFNAGSSTELGRACVFSHAAGALTTGPWWLDAVAGPPDRELWQGGGARQAGAARTLLAM
ncbi:MAG TPA: metallophosphoesterase [Polyangia bacterium]|jgi:3',5'-cyclic AMP phosphodiesterase CpdA|nr:metallophosphoesterase [Polyangia bacterium]